MSIEVGYRNSLLTNKLANIVHSKLDLFGKSETEIFICIYDYV